MGQIKNIKLHIVTDIKRALQLQQQKHNSDNRNTTATTETETTTMELTIEHMSRYVSPVNPAVYPHLTLVLLGIGIFFTAWFFVYEVTSTKYTRDIYKELLVALFAALFMGFGTVFLLLWVGIYV